MKQIAISFALLVFGLLAPLAAKAEVRLNPLFADNAVLQRDAEVAIWGMARDGEKVVVEIQDQKVAATVTDGKWLVKLAALPRRR